MNTLVRRQIPAKDLKVGDRLCFAVPRFDVTIEELRSARCGNAIGIFANNAAWTMWLSPEARLIVERTTMQWALADASAETWANLRRVIDLRHAEEVAAGMHG